MTVDKISFAALVQRFYSTSPADAEMLSALKSSYPYSQLIQTLVAKVWRDHQLPDHELQLQDASIRSADRAVLKEIIDTEFESYPGPQDDRVDQYQPSAIVKESVEQEGKESKINATPVGEPFATAAPRQTNLIEYESIDGVDVADQVMRDLEQLNTSRHNFEMLFVEYTEVQVPSLELKSNDNDAHVSEAAGREKTKDHRSRKERIIDAARSLKGGADIESSEPQTKKKLKNNPADELIDEIASNKEEITPENDRQKEQINIIDQFIKTSPSINNARDKQTNAQVDLNTVKSGEFGDNIVSETLVEILIKQGKKEKAVEVLKKLIWKYPQKKAYFASQIEELKK